MNAWSDCFVTPDWLFSRLTDPSVRIVDGSWYLEPDRDAQAEHDNAHIPGAVFFDLDLVADRESNLPHMLPAPDHFAENVGRLGISHRDTIIIYDGAGLFSAPRVRWTFYVMGASDVRILEGGLPAWRSQNYPVTDEISQPPEKEFKAEFDDGAIADLADMRIFTGNSTAQILDARPKARFDGVAPEPRAGLRSGHMPNSLSLPATDLIADNCLKSPEKLKSYFDALDIAPSRPIITTCGSGVTAAILSLALEVAGYGDTRLYDGSWAEWGSLPDTEVQQR